MPITGRPKKQPLVVTDDERAELAHLAQRIRVNRAVAFRARLVLACAAGVTETSVARRYRTTTAHAGTRGSRFMTRRVEGLSDERRAGAPRTVSDADVEAVVVQTLETKPAGATHWSTRTMAEKAGLSHKMVGRIWATFGPNPHH